MPSSQKSAHASRAGVSKATIYRRYPCKTDLVIAAADAWCRAEAPAPDTGSIRGDLAVAMPDNLVHGSDSPESAEREIALWFSDDELV